MIILKKKGLLQLTDFNLELAIKMWNEGKSAKTIANHFGVTKNVIIGRVHRARYKGMYVVQKAKPSAPRKRVLRPPKPGVSSSAGFQLKLIKGDAPVKQGLAIYDLEPDQCKYSIGESESGEYLFCGMPHANIAYCDEHHKLCHSRPEPKKKSTFIFDPKRKFLHYR